MSKWRPGLDQPMRCIGARRGTVLCSWVHATATQCNHRPSVAVETSPREAPSLKLSAMAIHWLVITGFKNQFSQNNLIIPYRNQYNRIDTTERKNTSNIAEKCCFMDWNVNDSVLWLFPANLVVYRCNKYVTLGHLISSGNNTCQEHDINIVRTW